LYNICITLLYKKKSFVFVSTFFVFNNVKQPEEF